MSNTGDEPAGPRPWLPGDATPAARAARMIRVDQAGEYGAKRIYEGQLAVMGHTAAGRIIHHMSVQEKNHLAAFDDLMVARRVRPTLLSPLWHAAGYALGAATALMGERTAMACTTAVEEEIDAHYTRQRQDLGDTDPELARLIAECHADELEHRDTAYTHGAREAPFYPLISGAIRAGSRMAIWLSERI